MKGTGKVYGLRIDNYVDERRDPIKSTVAAARYLRDLYDLFGAWPLAMAAYNAGENAVDRTGKRTFQQAMAGPADRFCPCVAVQLFAASIPIQNTPLGIPGENWLIGQVDEPALLIHCSLGTLAFSDIAGNRRYCRNLAVGIHNGRHGQGHLNGMSVFMDPHAFELLDADSRCDLLDEDGFLSSHQKLAITLFPHKSMCCLQYD